MLTITISDAIIIIILCVLFIIFVVGFLLTALR